MASLVGAGVGGTVGGVTGALIGMGLPESEAKQLERLIKKGEIFLSVHCTRADSSKKAKDILKKTGSKNISSTAVTKAEFDNAKKPTVRV